MQIATTIDYAAIQTTLQGIVQQARIHLQAIPRDDIQVEKKADNSFVTRADRETELFLREQLQKHFPEHSIVGEEFPSIEKNSIYQWIIDPIDGTHSFKHNIPLYGIIICLLEDGKPVVAAIDLPAIDRTYAAAKDMGATCNGVPIQIEDLQAGESIFDEVISTGERKSFVKCDRSEVFDTLMQSHNHIRVYSDCFGHMLAAEGVVGAMMDFNMRIWDCMASVLIVEEAGGKAICVGKRMDGELPRYDWVYGKPAVVDWLCSTQGLLKMDAALV